MSAFSIKLLNLGFYKSKQLNKDDYSDVVLANWDLITEHRVLFLEGHIFISIMIKDFAGTMHEMNVHPGQILALKELKDLYMVDPEPETDDIEVLSEGTPKATNPHEIETASIAESGGDEIAEEPQVEQ